MTLYTTMPLETVLQGFNEEMEPLHEIWVQGIHMQVEPIAPGMGKVVRLLNCSLDDYLNPELMPGSLIHYG
ncbi:YlzJ-like family protein [Paenibacillus sp. GSMTC-2017]|uniref:YlzJ-like family protein n=1 Tax=Paenibacillus sp. GSMTC-2017 TaxID=2794350 RepID=UPI0018D9512D|nr:YlzJ-like family protein [Paenibacillus sp. GSMTC-2017]MBH5316579.1 YlzJ-like family protein [Paenibacillus sp. GSMTC-2017]